MCLTKDVNISPQNTALSRPYSDEDALSYSLVFCFFPKLNKLAPQIFLSFFPLSQKKGTLQACVIKLDLCHALAFHPLAY